MNEPSDPWNSPMWIEMFKAAIDAGEKAIKAALLATGGASAATLALLGHLATAERRTTAQLFGMASWALAFFAASFLLAAIGAGLRYLSQESYAESMRRQMNDDGDGKSKWRQRGLRLQYAAILAVVVCVPLLLIGGWCLFEGLQAQYQTL